MRGHVRKRGKKWAFVVELDRDPVTGKRRQKWHSGYDRRGDAERAMSETIGKLNSGGYVMPSKLTVGEYLTTRWLPSMRTQVRRATFASYSEHVNHHLVPRIGAVPLQQLTADRLTAMYADLRESGRRDGEGLAPRTVRYIHQTMRQALEHAVDSDLVPRNVALKTKPPSAKQSRNRQAMRTWTPEQLGAFLESRRDDSLYALWHLFAMTGQRRGEALGLSDRLGPASIAMTMDTYSHAIPAMQSEAAARVAALVLGVSAE